jgi:hypothetical protein
MYSVIRQQARYVRVKEPIVPGDFLFAKLNILRISRVVFWELVTD